MADRDRDDWDRGREYDKRNREYGRGSDKADQDRGMVSRGADEVRSWFGDDEARRRREMDERRERHLGDRDRTYGANSERARREHGWGSPDRSDPAWQSGRSGSYGDQRDFLSRSSDWTGSREYSPRGRDWYDPGYDRGPQWQGGSRDYGDEDASRRSGNWQSSGSNYTAGQTNPSFSGGYGAGTYDSGTYRNGAPGPFGTYRGHGPQGPRPSGWESYGPGGSANWGPDTGPTGEGRWLGEGGSTTNYSAGGGFSGRSFSSGTFAGRGPRNYQRSDERIREDVNERLTADPRIDASEIDVRVQNGEVTLNGMVDERRTRRLAEEVIEDLPGVRDVRNDLRVSRGNWFGGTDQESETHHQAGDESRNREDGSIGRSGNPEQRDDVTTLKTKDPGKR